MFFLCLKELFYTGNEKEDTEVKTKVKDLLDIIRCVLSFVQLYSPPVVNFRYIRTGDDSISWFSHNVYRIAFIPLCFLMYIIISHFLGNYFYPLLLFV